NRQVTHIIPARTRPNRRGRRRLQSLVAEPLGSVGCVSWSGDMRALVKLRNYDFGAFPMEEMALTETLLTARATGGHAPCSHGRRRRSVARDMPPRARRRRSA